MKLNKLSENYLKNKTAGYLSKDQNSDNLKRYLRLDLGENLLANPQLLKKLQTLSREILAYYSDPSNSQIKRKIAKLYNLSSKNIAIANNSNEIIDVIPRMLISKKSKVIIITPTFFRYIDASLKAGGKIIKINLKKEDEYYPTSKIIEKICMASIQHQASIIWICNPNNPTGEIYQLKDIERIVKVSSGLVVVDEAFYEYYDQKNKNSAIKLVNKYPNLLILRTLSKAYGLAGLRFGYALGHPKIIDIIENYQDTLLMTSGFIVKLVEIILSNHGYLRKSIHETQKQKTFLYSEISKLTNLEIGADTKANIYLLRHKHKDIYQELFLRNILTADFRNAEGIKGLGYVRVTIGKKDENQLLLEALKEIN